MGRTAIRYRTARRRVNDGPGWIMLIKLIGYPPFCSENAHDVYRKIIDWRNHLCFPDDIHLSRESEDLIRR